MRHVMRFLALGLMACSNDPPGDDEDGGGDDDGTDVVAGTQDTGTTADTDTTLRDGCYAESTSDYGDDGVIEFTGLDVYGPVRTDLLTHHETLSHGDVLWAFDWVYDGDGYLVLWSQDGDGDGTYDDVSAYTNDADGNVLVWEHDDDGDGDVDEIRTYTYTEDGDLLTFAQDADADGEVDYGYAYTFEGDVQVSAIEDEDGDEITDVWWVYNYDEIGRYVGSQADRGNDGALDYESVRTYTDPVEYIGGTVIDEDYDGIPDFSDTFVALNGELLFLEEDEGADAFIDYTGSWTFDGDTALLLTEDEELSTPPPDDDFVDVTHREYSYDDNLRRVEMFTTGELVDEDTDYDRLARTTWTFGGTCP